MQSESAHFPFFESTKEYIYIVKKKKILHFSINGFPGVGKTEILIGLLTSRLRVHFIPRYTTRERRPGEEDSPEYRFVSENEFAVLRKGGFFIKRTIRRVESEDGKFHFTAIIKKIFWPEPPEGTQLIVSFFGRSAFLIRRYTPEMKLVFISHHSIKSGLTEIKMRVAERCRRHGKKFYAKWRQINRWYQQEIWTKYDHVVYNDGTTPRKCVEEIIALAEREMSELSMAV